MKALWLLMVLFAFSLNSFGQKATKQDTVSMLGRISKENFYAKGGKHPVEGAYDYFFVSGDKRYFIKCYGSSFTKEMLDKWAGQSVRVKGVIKKGEWDSTGDPDKVQSRTGEYITLIEVKGT